MITANYVSGFVKWSIMMLILAHHQEYTKNIHKNQDHIPLDWELSFSYSLALPDIKSNQVLKSNIGNIIIAKQIELMICNFDMHFDYSYVKRNKAEFDKLPFTGSNRNHTENVTTEYGGHQNYRITRNYGCTFQGSLCKYYFGNNFNTLSHRHFKLAIERLSDELHINFKQATVARLDVATNLLMNFDPICYTPCILSYNRLERKTYQFGGVSLEGQTKTLRFYSKNMEAARRNELVPVEFVNRFYYRLEVSTMGHVKRRLPFKIDNVESFYKPVTFRSMIENWGVEFYSRVQYKEHAISDIIGYENATLNDRLWLDRIKRYGSEIEAISEQKLLYNAKKITLSQYRTAVKKIGVLCKRHINYTMNISLKNELLEKVVNKVEENKSLIA